MYRLLYIKIDNFRGKKELKMQFADNNVSIIHGTNGSGKTTLLKVIHGILSMNESILQNENINRALIVFKELTTNKKKHFEVEYLEEEEEFLWKSDIEDLDEYIESFSSLVFGVNRGITFNASVNKVIPIDIHKTFRQFNINISEDTIKNTRTSLFDIADYINTQVLLRSKRAKRTRIDIDLDDNHLMLDNLSMSHVEVLLNEKYFIDKKYMSDRVQNALFHTLAQVLDNKEAKKDNNFDPNDFNTKLKTYHNNLLELLSDLEGNEISKKIIKSLSNYDLEDENPFEGKELISNLVYNMITELDKEKGVLNTVSKLVEEFNQYLEQGKKLIVDEKGARIETTDSDHGIEKLSSGERHLLSFLTLFIIEGSTRNILMIDEPEISLNLEWQSKLLPLLTKFAPNSQIIVATHSPAIAEFNTKNLVEIK